VYTQIRVYQLAQACRRPSNESVTLRRRRHVASATARTRFSPSSRSFSSFGGDPGIRLPSALYDSLVKEGRLEGNEAQRKLLPELDRLAASLPKHQEAMKAHWTKLDTWMEERAAFVEAETQRRRRVEEAWQYHLKNLNKNVVTRALNTFKKWTHANMGLLAAPTVTLYISEPPGIDGTGGTGGGGKRIEVVVSAEKASDGTHVDYRIGDDGQIKGPRPEFLSDDYYVAKGLSPRPLAPAPPKGLYLHGGVGIGKSMLMDLLFAATSKTLEHRRRIHFQAFMTEVFEEMHSYHTQLKDTIANLRAETKDASSSHIFENINANNDPKAGSPPNPFSSWEGGTLSDLGGVLQRRGRAREAAIRSSLRTWHPLRYVSERLVGGRKLLFLAFDEFQLNDVATTAILKGLFERLYEMGVIIVATGNRTPKDLERFFHSRVDYDAFLGLWTKWCEFREIQSNTDFRYLQSQLFSEEKIRRDAETGGGVVSVSVDLRGVPDGFPFYVGEGGGEGVDGALDVLLENQAKATEGEELEVGSERKTFQWKETRVGFGRTLRHRQCGGVAIFDFEELVACALGPSDYIAISQEFHTVTIRGVRQMSISTRDHARRFISLVDELYNRHTRLIFDSEVAIEALFDGDESLDDQTLRGLQIESELQFDRMPMQVERNPNLAPASDIARIDNNKKNNDNNHQNNDKNNNNNYNINAAPLKIDMDGMQLSGSHTLFTGEDEKFAFQRAISRLTEMQSPVYFLRRPLHSSEGRDMSTPISAAVATSASSMG